MELRKMKIEDYDQVFDLWVRTPGMGLNTTDDSFEGIEKYLKRNPNTCYVAVEGQQIVGAILSGNDGRRGYISHTAVEVEMQRQGIGTRLVAQALEALHREGITKVALVVFQRNLNGNTFWEKLGFSKREDLVYRNKELIQLDRVDT
ncbi:MAG: GNAT family N-acetyltransferase [bacterium]|nr:GNAT family N-acetyltransferase [bacterium]